MKKLLITLLILLGIYMVVSYYIDDATLNRIENVVRENTDEDLSIDDEEVEETTQSVKVVKKDKEINEVVKAVQEEEEDAGNYLKFKGIPIKGSMESFCKKLKAKGFTQTGRDGKDILFGGDFTGKTATVKVESDNDGKNVYRVIVMFTPSRDWKSMVETYNHYKKLYTSKYGAPVGSKERINPITDSNSAKMLELNDGNVTWFSRWKDAGGTIEISIDKYDVVEGVVVIRYCDSQNEAAKIKSDLEEI